MSTQEQKSSQDCRLRAADWGSRLLRNNSGALLDKEGRLIRFGLGNESKRINALRKSSDYIGYTPVTITPEMVGKTVAVYTAIEMKAPGFVIRDFKEGSREWAQQKFMNPIITFGGIAGFAWDETSTDAVFHDFNKRMMK